MASIVALCATVSSFASAALAQEDAAAAAQREIEALIASVARLEDAEFIRNGKAYTASNAARFLGRKWRSRESEVRSAEDFIERIASFSSTTSKPYLVRFADGREVPSAEVLRAELAKLRADVR